MSTMQEGGQDYRLQAVRLAYVCAHITPATASINSSLSVRPIASGERYLRGSSLSADRTPACMDLG